MSETLINNNTSTNNNILKSYSKVLLNGNTLIDMSNKTNTNRRKQFFVNFT